MLVIFFISTLLLADCGCNQAATTAAQRKEVKTNASAEDLPSFATVIVDFSASFAPLSQIDRLALKETGRALADLAVQDWPPPTTIVWRKIGTASATSAPFCDVLEFNRSIIGAATSVDRLRAQLDACAESVVSASRAAGTQEPYTDISDGIMMAVQNWAGMRGKKALIILSDFLEDLPKGKRATPIQLQGESVLLVHRPGTTEASDPATYLNRISNWKSRLEASGAQSVAILPAFRATLHTIEQAFMQQPVTGTSISLVTDLAPPMSDQRVVNRAVTTLSRAIASRASEWSAPVTAGWFATAQPAWRTTAIAPVVYTPRLARRANELNSTDVFAKAIEEMGLALHQRQNIGNGDIDGTLRLISNSDSASARYLVLLSDFANQPPSTAKSSLGGNRILLVYRATAAIDGAQFFDRLARWQEYFKASGVTQVCALDVATLTDSAIGDCLQR